MTTIQTPEEGYDYRKDLVGKEVDDQVDITVYVNSRGTMSPVKTLGFSPITLTVHQNYHMLEPKGKALFRKNAYDEYLKSDLT